MDHLGEDSVLKIYRDVSDLEELREFWSSRRTWPSGNLDFFISFVCSQPEFVRPHVVAIFRGNRPRSLLLGRLEKRKINIKFGYLRFPSPTLRILTFDDGGWLSDLSAHDGELCIRSVLGSLRNDEADAAVLEHLNTSYPIYGLARSLPPAIIADHSVVADAHWVRRLASGRSFLEDLSANERYNQKKRARRLIEAFDGEIRIDCFHDDTQIERLARDAEAVARTSYQRGLGVGYVDDAQMRRRLRVLAQLGMLRAHVLYIRKEPCAFWIASLSGGILFSDFLAFDPAYAKHAPGLFLLMKIIEEVSNIQTGESTQAIDFGFGDAEYKARLGNDRRDVASIHIFSPTLKGAMINLLRWVARSADRSAKSVLRSIGILPHAKRLWRQLMTRPS